MRDKAELWKKTTLSGEGCYTGVTGIEPAISGLTGRRDNQLRYTPRHVVRVCMLCIIQEYPHLSTIRAPWRKSIFHE